MMNSTESEKIEIQVSAVLLSLIFRLSIDIAMIISLLSPLDRREEPKNSISSDRGIRKEGQTGDTKANQEDRKGR